MNSSEHETSDETQTGPPEHEVIDLAEPSTPSDSAAVSQEDDPDLPLEEPAQTKEPSLQPAEPGIYTCEEGFPGNHPVLAQRIQQGENDFTEETNPDVLLAIAALVEAGVLRKA